MHCAMKTKGGLSNSLKHYTLNDMSSGVVVFVIYHLIMSSTILFKDLFWKVHLILVIVTSVINVSMRLPFCSYSEINASCTFVCIDNSMIKFHLIKDSINVFESVCHFD